MFLSYRQVLKQTVEKKACHCFNFLHRQEKSPIIIIIKQLQMTWSCFVIWTMFHYKVACHGFALSGHTGLNKLSTTFYFQLSANAKVILNNMAVRVCEETFPYCFFFIIWSSRTSWASYDISGTSILRMSYVHHFVIRALLHMPPFYELR